MDNNLISRETLEQFVDTLLAQKYPTPNQITPAERANLRTEAVEKLDDAVSTNIVSSLTRPQLAELTELFDRDDGDPEAYREFFDRNHINLQQIVATTLQNFQAEFIGGQNA